MNITVNTFRRDTDRQAAIKPLEEAAEVFAGFQDVDACSCGSSEQCKSCETREERGCCEFYDLADEIADCIQACANLADRYGIDLQAAMERCERRNRERGRYD